jgi:hypothetical protein
MTRVKTFCLRFDRNAGLTAHSLNDHPVSRFLNDRMLATGAWVRGFQTLVPPFRQTALAVESPRTRHYSRPHTRKPTTLVRQPATLPGCPQCHHPILEIPCRDLHRRPAGITAPVRLGKRDLYPKPASPTASDIRRRSRICAMMGSALPGASAAYRCRRAHMRNPSTEPESRHPAMTVWIIDAKPL